MVSNPCGSQIIKSEKLYIQVENVTFLGELKISSRV